MTDDERIKWIDNASYEDLLYTHRFQPIGSPYFSGPVGEHFASVMNTRQKEVGNAAHVAASKAIGW